MWPFDADIDVAADDSGWSGVGPTKTTSPYVNPSDTGTGSNIPFPDDFPGAEESDLVYYPQDDDISFPDDLGGPFASRRSNAKKQDPPGEMPSPPSTMGEKNVKPVWRAVIDEATGLVYYYNKRTRKATWNKPNGVDIVNLPPRQYQQGNKTVADPRGNGPSNPHTGTTIPKAEKQIEESKVDDVDEKDNANEGNGKAGSKDAAVAVAGNPVIIIDHNDDVSEASSLSASNMGWYRQQSAAHKKRQTGTLKEPAPTGIIFVQGSCSERVNGIYIVSF